MLSVTSEIGRLRRVLVHEPGREIDHMVPAMMEELLFDDILFGEGARQEHRRFRRVLHSLGVEVLEAQSLLAEALAVDEGREWILRALLEDLPAESREQLESATPEDLAEMLVAGVRLGKASREMEADDLFALPPIANWCFQRDPQVVLGGGLIVCSMASGARWREALLSQAIFRYSPALGVEPWIDPHVSDASRPLVLGLHRPHFEGGDVMIFSKEVIAVGYSQRTNRTGIRQLARALHRREGAPRYMLIAVLPTRRAYMHLDTLISVIDRDAVLTYPPVIDPDGREATKVFEVDLHEREFSPRARPEGLLAALAGHGLDYRPIPCGGEDPMQQQREQWTDGANALAVDPGTILLYDRNVETLDMLAKNGFAIVQADDLLLGHEEIDLDRNTKTCIVIPSHELSRARGGPHCLSHPLLRDEIA